jgi:hypothetical protein
MAAARSSTDALLPRTATGERGRGRSSTEAGATQGGERAALCVRSPVEAPK